MNTPDQIVEPPVSEQEIETENIETKESWSQKLISDCDRVKKFAEQQQTAQYASEGRFNSLLGSLRNKFTNPRFEIDFNTAETCLQILKEAKELCKDSAARPEKLFDNAIEAIERNRT